jgi:hypothetical protein
MSGWMLVGGAVAGALGGVLVYALLRAVPRRSQSHKPAASSLSGHTPGRDPWPFDCPATRRQR